MRQSKARRERHKHLQAYQFQLRMWQNSKPAWWRIFARMKWKANKPVYDRR